VTAIEGAARKGELEGEDAVERMPGDPDMWLFVVVESLVFTSYFCVYLYARTQDEAGILDAQSALTLPLGVLGTIVLLTSSWAIARCVQHTRAARYEAARRFALGTIGLGVLFFALKVAEWVRLIRDGNTFTSSEFMQHFFFLTSIHAVHLVIGLVVLGVLVGGDARRR